MRIGLGAAAAIIAACCATPTYAETSSGYGMGGRTGQFAKDREAFRNSGEQFRIKGHCQSACTMFLALPNACVEPSAQLLFHAGSNARATSDMMNSYNSALQAYLNERGVMNSPAFHTISGSDIIRKFGYKACPK